MKSSADKYVQWKNEDMDEKKIADPEAPSSEKSPPKATRMRNRNCWRPASLYARHQSPPPAEDTNDNTLTSPPSSPKQGP